MKRLENKLGTCSTTRLVVQQVLRFFRLKPCKTTLSAEIIRKLKVSKQLLCMLIAARNSSDPKVLGLLQQAGGDINNYECQHIKLPPFFYALAFNHHKNVIDILNWFRDNEEYIKITEFNGLTALRIAFAFGTNYKVIEWLKENGYETSIDSDVDLFGYAAANNANASFMKMLCDKFGIHAEDSTGKKPLHYAARSNENPSVVKLLIDDETINSRDEDGSTPLHYAAYNPNHAVIKLLLDHKEVNVHAVDNNGDTPLHNAACIPNAEVARALLKAGAHIYINTPNHRGYTPLYYAFQFRNHEVYNLLNTWRIS
jgi:ankyrin repeat protein